MRGKVATGGKIRNVSRIMARQKWERHVRAEGVSVKVVVVVVVVVVVAAVVVAAAVV